jgi:hypothetical protein
MALAAMGGAVISAWIALRLGPAWLTGGGGWGQLAWAQAQGSGPAWSPSLLSPAWIAAVFFLLPAVLLAIVACRPVIEIFDTHLRVGRREIPWSHIRRVDQTGWNVPLAVYLTLSGEQKLLIVYPGDVDSSASLLRHLRRYAREALLDGVPYRQFWGEPPANERRQITPPRYPLLRPEDEEEVERLFQRLKSVGHLERGNPDEK